MFQLNKEEIPDELSKSQIATLNEKENKRASIFLTKVLFQRRILEILSYADIPRGTTLCASSSSATKKLTNI